VGKRIDGRTAKGLRTKQLVRESILAAYIDLIRNGVPMPTARETVERAGLSLRVIFNHFPDLQSLRIAAFQRMQEESSKLFSETFPDRGSAAERLALFVQKHAQRLEYVTPAHRTAAMVESLDMDVAKALRVARGAARRDLERAMGPALKALSPEEKHALLTALHTVCSWNAWDFLRTHYHLSPARACAVMTSITSSVLAAAERRVHQR